MKSLYFFIALTIAWTSILKCESACTYRDVRLYDGTGASNSSGMLQICDNLRRWTAVCDYRWKHALSVKVCKSLGHTNPKPITTINSNKYWNRFGYVASLSSSSCPSSRKLANCLSRSTYYLNSRFFCNKNRDTINIECYRNTSGCTYNHIRLYNSTTRSTVNATQGGMLQMCSTARKWTAVCDFSWGCAEAITACKQLGVNNAKVSYRLNAGPWTEYGFGPYRTCSSTATSLTSCTSYALSYRRSLTYCDPIRDTVRLTCTPRSAAPNVTCSPNYTLRLVNGTTPDEGRVEFCYNNVWTTFCGLYYLSQKAGSTMCNQLGYQGNQYATPYYDGRFGKSETDEYARSIYCRNGYNSMRYCRINVAGSGSACNSPSLCSGNQLGLRCYKPQNCNEGDVRLVGGILDKEGRLEMCANGVWGSICSNSFSLSAAYVACKQAGHTNVNGAVINRYGKYGIGEGPIVYNALNCFGHEDTLDSCKKVEYPNFYCAQNRVIGLLCLDMCKEGDVRLVNGSHPFEGTIEVCLDNSWTLVAEHGWDDADARVVCKQIGGYNYSAGVAKMNSYYGKPKRSVRYSNVFCRGTEKELTDCTHHTFDFEYGRTYNTSVAGVDCGILSNPTTVTPIRATPSQSLFIAVSPQTQANTGGQTDTEKSSVFISGILFFAIGISVLLIAIVIMVFVVLRMKKLSLKNNNTATISAVQRMSSISEPTDIKPSPSTLSYDDELLS